MERTLYQKARAVALSVINFEDSQLGEEELEQAMQAYKARVEAAYLAEKKRLASLHRHFVGGMT